MSVYLQNNIPYRRTLSVLLTLLLCGSLLNNCTDDPEPPPEKIESITFDRSRALIKTGEAVTVNVIIKPDSAKRNERLQYNSVNDGIIEIRESSNDGLIVQGLKSGSTVIMAKSAQATGYLEVIVSEEAAVTHYINVAAPVIEMFEGERRTTQVSLYGGTIPDNSGFIWTAEADKDTISINGTGNTVIIDGKKRGTQKITVSHAKSEYDGEILVFVKGVNESVKYITGTANVVMVPLDEQYHDVYVALKNGAEDDKRNIVYSISEGENSIEIIGNGDVCNIKGLKAGTAVISVTHELAEVPFDIRVIVYDTAYPYITVDQSFFLINVNESVTAIAALEDAKEPATALSEFSYIIDEHSETVVEVIQTNNNFYIRGKEAGSAKIIISNNRAEMSRELLVVVRNESIYRDDCYISTSQNVIQTQVGAAETMLRMQLVNGNESDANNFEWVVEDSSIVQVESAHGIVRNTRAAINTVFNAVAVITPQTAGITRIHISHPKSESTATVLVKVYPQNTFAEIPVRVSADGLFKVIKGEPQTVRLSMMSGEESNTGTLHWSTEDNTVASVNTSAHGMINVLNGVSTGMTRMTVNGDRLAYPHESIVLAGTPEEIDMMSVIYVDTIYQTMVTEQVVRIEVKDSRDKYHDSNDFNAKAEDPGIVYAVMIKNQLVLQGKSPGETKVRISHADAMNSIVINVRVDPANITIDKPYYISGPEMVGVVRNVAKEITIDLSGAPEAEKGKTRWSVDDTGTLNLNGNGLTARVTGKRSNAQTTIRANHAKSANEKVIIVYVVENESELTKVAIGIKNERYLFTKGDSVLMTLITNATDSQKKDLQWNVVYGDDVVNVDGHYDSAMVRAVGAGNAEIAVTHPDGIVPLSIYVSVVDELSEEKVIIAPAVIELITNESKIVPVRHRNLTAMEQANILWEAEDTSIASIKGNGDSAYMLGLKEGVSYVNITQNELQYRHRSTLLCADTPERLAQMYVMGIASSYYEMTEGDEIRIRLQFGSTGFPETEQVNIAWFPDATGTVEVAGSSMRTDANGENRYGGSGAEATVIARNAGAGSITVFSQTSFNKTLTINFMVRSKGEVSPHLYEFRDYPKIKGMLFGSEERITLHWYDSNGELTGGYSTINHKVINSAGAEDDSIISVNRADNVLSVTAKYTKGQSFIEAASMLAKERARMMIYTAATQEELDNYYPIVADKNNYLLQVGESTAITLTTEGGEKDDHNLHEIQWGIENSGVIENPVFRSKKEAEIKGKHPGSCVININYKGNTVERIFVTVVEHTEADRTKQIVTESIIGLVKGENRVTQIHTNLSESELRMVRWESGNEALVKVSGSGENVTLTANTVIPDTSETYVTVSLGSSLKRHILVYVCDTETEVTNYRAMNIETQYYRLGINEDCIVPMYYAPNKSSSPTLWVDKYGNGVVTFESMDNGAKIAVTGVNEGIAVLEASNTGLTNPRHTVRLYIEVSSRYTHLPKTPELKYLTAGKTVYALNPDEPDVFADMSVIGIGMNNAEMNGITWEAESGGRFVRLFPNGKDCRVLPNQAGLEGESTIRVFYAQNIVRIKIIVTRTKIAGYPHIVIDDVIKLGLEEERTVEVNVAETAAYDKNRFAVQVISGTCVKAAFTGNLLRLTAQKNGQAVLRLSCNGVCPDTKDVTVIVTSTPDGLVYVTTRDNFNVIGMGEAKTVTVETIGISKEIAGINYQWHVESGGDFITLNAAGAQARIEGKSAAGTAKIRVRNTLAVNNGIYYDTYIYARVTQAELDPVYITTDRTIIPVTQNESAYVNIQTINGNPSLNNTFYIKQQPSPNYAEVQVAGNQAVILAKQPGICWFTLASSAREIQNDLRIMAVIEPAGKSSDVYVSVDSTLVDIAPGGRMVLSARVVGGTPEDIFGMRWTIKSQQSIEKNSNGTHKTVINWQPAYDKAVIEGINEGEAILNVALPGKTNYSVDIKVMVRQYSNIRFSVRNVRINAGESVNVDMTAPRGTTILYSASKYQGKDIVRLTTTNSKCAIVGIAPGMCVVQAYNAAGTMSDEIIVEVMEVVHTPNYYIDLPDVLFSMTDRQSAGNKLVINAQTAGNKSPLQQFTDLDNTRIQWTVKNGNDVVNIDGSVNNTLRAASASIGPRKVGSAEITLTHPDMRDYSKSVYVQVTPFNAHFYINPTVIILEEGEQQTVTCTIAEQLEKDYRRDVVWKCSDEEGLKVTVSDNNQSVKLEGVREGNYVVSAVYNNETTENCCVYVQKRKSLTLSNGYIMVLAGSPYGETKEISFELEGIDKELVYTTDTLDCLADKDNPDGKKAIEIDYKKKVIRITGGSREGYTRISFTANNIERIVTVYTSYNYTFALKDVNAIYGQPLQKIELDYLIFPLKDKVWHDNNIPLHGGWWDRDEPDTSPARNRRHVEGLVNYEQQKISLKLLHCTGRMKDGYSEILFFSDYNQKIGLHLAIPVYIYYPKIDITFKGEGNKLSWIDTSNNAIYIANGESFNVTLEVDEQKFYGHDLEFHDVVNFNDKAGRVYDEKCNLVISLKNKPRTINFFDKRDSKPSGTGYPSMTGIEYIGDIEIPYSYSAGGADVTVFNKKFMLYQTTWLQ